MSYPDGDRMRVGRCLQRDGSAALTGNSTVPVRRRSYRCPASVISAVVGAVVLGLIAIDLTAPLELRHADYPDDDDLLRVLRQICVYPNELPAELSSAIVSCRHCKYVQSCP